MELRVRSNSLPSELDRYDASDLLRKSDEHGVSEVEMLLGGIAPSSQGTMRTEVSCRHRDSSATWKTVLGAIGIAGELVAGTAAEAAVKQGRTECRGVGSVASAVEIPKSTSPTCIPRTVPRKLERVNPEPALRRGKGRERTIRGSRSKGQIRAPLNTTRCIP